MKSDAADANLPLQPRPNEERRAGRPNRGVSGEFRERGKVCDWRPVDEIRRAFDNVIPKRNRAHDVLNAVTRHEFEQAR